MDVTVFETFPEGIEPYTFLQISRGTMAGNIVLSKIISDGIFKIRNGKAVSNNQETRDSSSTLHIYPSEAFIALVGGYKQLVGHGMRIGGQDFDITGATGGKNYNDGSIEHYRLTLDVADFSEYEDAGS